jgi:hypothetical protein
MKRVVIESPFAAGPRAERAEVDRLDNQAYTARLGRFLCLRGDAPYASHLVLTHFLEDMIASERQLGIDLGLAWGLCGQLTVVGVDRGISRGMEYGIKAARDAGRAVEWVSLGCGGRHEGRRAFGLREDKLFKQGDGFGGVLRMHRGRSQSVQS